MWESENDTWRVELCKGWLEYFWTLIKAIAETKYSEWMVLAISDPTGTFKFYNKRSLFVKCNRKKAPQTMAGLQNSGRACWNFGWFCHHQKNKEAGNDCDSAKRMVSQLDGKMVEFLIVLPSPMMTIMMTLPIEGCFRMVKGIKGKCGEQFKSK